MTEQVLGITVSHHQGEMNFQKAYDAGARYAVIRLGSITDQTGELYTDWQFERNARMAAPIMPIGFFWFFRPKYSSVLQIEYFCSKAEQAAAEAGYKYFRMVLDVEVPGQNLGKHVLQALECIESFTGRVPMIYTRGEFWNTQIGLVYWAKKYPLHIARYTMDPHPWVTAAGKVLKKVKPLGWDDWTFWQWSADGNGRGHEFGSPRVKGSDSICLERFNGDRVQFADFVFSDKLPEPGPVMGWKESIDAWARSMGYMGPRP